MRGRWYGNLPACMVRTLGGGRSVRRRDVVFAQLFNTRADDANGRPPRNGRHAYLGCLDVGRVLG